jgi:hypothetical protein
MDRYLHDPDYPGHSSARGKQAARGEDRRRVHEMQSKLDALEDRAGDNGIPPGTLRGG